jgi:ornithine cyclodeaminase/alanine dehydrogenase-like protein (mu-crystallin family)
VVREPGADIVYLATSSGGRVVADRDVLGGMLPVLSIAGPVPDQRERHADVLAKADVLAIDTSDLLEESEDAFEALADGLDPSRAGLPGNHLGGAATSVGTTVYKSVGSPERVIVLARGTVALMQDQHPGRVIDSLTGLDRNLSLRET